MKPANTLPLSTLAKSGAFAGKLSKIRGCNRFFFFGFSCLSAANGSKSSSCKTIFFAGAGVCATRAAEVVSGGGGYRVRISGDGLRRGFIRHRRNEIGLRRRRN